MTNIKKVVAGIVVGAALTSTPLVAFAATAFADTGAAKPVADGPSHMNIPPWGYRGSEKEQRVLVNSGSRPNINEGTTVIPDNPLSVGSLRDGNAAHCGGGITC